MGRSGWLRGLCSSSEGLDPKGHMRGNFKVHGEGRFKGSAGCLSLIRKSP